MERPELDNYKDEIHHPNGSIEDQWRHNEYVEDLNKYTYSIEANLKGISNMTNILQETGESISLMKGCLSKLSDDTRELEDILDNWRFRNQEVINKALVQTSN